MRTAKLAVSLLVMFALVLGAAPAHAETVNCTPITVLPAVITVQGIYCFTGHLATAITAGNAIDIQTNNVILDLNGFKLGGLAAGPATTAIGIQALDRQNITIKNGTIRGFLRGISLAASFPIGASQGHVVEDIRADQNTFIGIDVVGDGNIVRNNQVVATAATAVNASANGIFIAGNGARVLNNDVINTVKQGTGTAVGIACGNLAVVLTSCNGALMVNNRITQADIGIQYSTGSSGKYRDNLTFGVTTPFSGGTDAGNNN